MSEERFGEIVVGCLRGLGFDTWQEVKVLNGVIDIVGRIKDVYCSFELKMSLNDDVLIQAMNNNLFTDYSCIVIPHKPKFKMSFVKQHFINFYGLGLITIKNDIESVKNFKSDKKSWFFENNLFFDKDRIDYMNDSIIVRYQPEKHNIIHPVKYYLFDDQKESRAGSESGSVITPFKRSCNLIYEYLKEHPKASKKEVWENLKQNLHWASYNSMCASFRRFSHTDTMKKIIWK